MRRFTSGLDHLVVAAATLQQGAEYIRETLGVEIPPGGAHPQMGTHNRLMRLSESTFLEVIAIDPELPSPNRPRWFGLDDPAVRSAIALSPALLTWVANTDNIHACLAAAPIPLGRPELIRRDRLSWLFGLPPDGHLFAGGLLPCMIQWHCQPHPASLMPDLGCRLVDLHLHHQDPEWLRQVLETIGLEDQVTVAGVPSSQAPFLEARLQTPAGIRQLRSPGF